MSLKNSDHFEPHRQATSGDVRLTLGETDDSIMMLAMTVLLLVGLIPLIGGAVWLIAYVIGLGGIILQGRAALATASTPSTPQLAS